MATNWNRADDLISRIRRPARSRSFSTNKSNITNRKNMKLNTLHELYVDELRDLYNAESQLLKALPKMAKAASATELKQAFEQHLEQTKGHVNRLTQIFDELDES